MTSYWLLILFAGVIIACLTAPVGCLIVWQKKSFLGETLAHASLSGVALSLMLGISPLLGMMGVGLMITGLLSRSYEEKIPQDAYLAIIAQGGLALGFLLLSTLKGQRIDINAYLFGDLLTISWGDVGLCAALAVGGLLFISYRFQSMIALVIHEDLARVEGLISGHFPLHLSFFMTLIIATLLPIVGVLLLTALMIIPAVTARYCSQTPGSMMIGAVVFSNITMAGGLIISYTFNLPTSPTLVMVSLGLLIGTYSINKMKE